MEMASLKLILAIFLHLIPSFAAVASPVPSSSDLLHRSNIITSKHHIQSSLNTGWPLRILCVGDSITVGIGDGYPILRHENNCYRLDLYNKLSSAGVEAEFIGTQMSGTNNPQPMMEGYGGETIQQIHKHMLRNGILRQRPNLVLIHAGTNDNNIDTELQPVHNASHRLSSLLDFVAFSVPKAVVLVAMLIQDDFRNNQVHTDNFNHEVVDLVQQKARQGYNMMTVDMSSIGGTELVDGIHPDPEGYEEMAQKWFEAIEQISPRWWSAARYPAPPILNFSRNTRCVLSSISWLWS